MSITLTASELSVVEFENGAAMESAPSARENGTLMDKHPSKHQSKHMFI
jgi:hypothetical protein